MNTSGLPKTFPNIIGSEFAERCSYYAVSVLTPVCLTQKFGMTGASASGIMYQFITISYFTCVLGGIAADWYLGRFRAILVFAWFTVAGHLLLAAFIDSPAGFRAALVCIAIGTGFIKPNVSALLGDQYGASAGEARLANAFNWFYFSINAGSILSFTLAPVLPGADGFGWSGAYAFPAGMMAAALFLLWIGRKHYIRIPPAGAPEITFIGMNIKALRLYFRQPGQNPWRALEARYGEEKVDGVLAVWRVATFFLFVPIAWSAYNTNGVDWLLDAQSDYMIKTFFGVTLQAGQLQTVNPVCILAFIPFSLWLFPRLERRTGVAFTTRRKMLFGFLLLLAAMLTESWVSHRIDLHRPVHAGWQVLALIVLSAAEVLISISGLQYGYTHAPRFMKSTIGSIWLLTTAVGNGLNACLKSLAAGSPAFSFLKCNTLFYWVLCGALALNILFYRSVMPKLKEKMYL